MSHQRARGKHSTLQDGQVLSQLGSELLMMAVVTLILVMV